MEDETAQQALCLSCGLCCDGTLFGSVPLKAADAVAPLNAAGIEIESRGSERYFKQPCSAYRQGCCHVYADRPTNCRRYRCQLLKQYEDKAISWNEAQQRIGRVQWLKETLRSEQARVLGEGSRMSLVAQLHLTPTQAELAADAALLKTWAPIMMRLSALLDCLRKHFQQPQPADNS